MEIITYYCFTLAFIANIFAQNKKINKERVVDIFDSGVFMVSAYLIQILIGILITFVGTLFIKGLISAAGTFLCYEFGENPATAMNFGDKLFAKIRKNE